MTESVVGMRVEGTMVVGTEGKRGRSHRLRVAGYGVIVLVFVALLILGVALHDGTTTHSVADVAPTMTTSQRSFPPVSAPLLPHVGPAAPYMEDFTPQPGENR